MQNSEVKAVVPKLLANSMLQITQIKAQILHKEQTLIQHARVAFFTWLSSYKFAMSQTTLQIKC